MLNFHGIGQPHGGVPPEEIPYWIGRERFRSLLDHIWEKHDPQDFAFTFDDGNASDLDAAELLAERGTIGRFFLLTGRFDHPEYVSCANARALVDSGMAVGLHGRDHVDWSKLDVAGLASETVAARTELADAIGRPVTEVAIPFGAYDRRVMSWLKKQGFAHIHTSDQGKASDDARIWNRHTLRSDMTDAAIEAILIGRPTPAQRARRMASRIYKRYLK